MAARLTMLIQRARQRAMAGEGGINTANRLGISLDQLHAAQDDQAPLHAIQNAPAATGGVPQARSSVGADHAARQGLLLALAAQRARNLQPGQALGSATNRRLSMLGQGTEPADIQRMDAPTYAALQRWIQANRINRVGGPGADRYTRFLGP